MRFAPYSFKVHSAACRTLLRLLGASLVPAAMTLLTACTVGTPWPRHLAGTPEQAGETVVLVLTHVVVDTSQRGEFDRQTNRVLAGLDRQPGLIGYSARRQLLGDEAWTMSVWADDAARAAFVRSALHREAVDRSAPALKLVELKRLTLARKDLPRDWDAVLRLLAEPDGRRGYWD